GEAEARHRAEQTLAGAVIDQGIALCDLGEVSQGMLWLTRGLELAVRAGDADLERVARVNLAAWRGRLFDGTIQLNHNDWVWTVAYSPDGKTAVTAGKDCTARLWDVASGKPRGEPLKHTHPVWAVAFSPD